MLGLFSKGVLFVLGVMFGTMLGMFIIVFTTELAL